MRNLLNTKRGFTLVEVIVYTSILVVILLLIVSFIVSFGKAYNVLRTTIHINNSATISFERMIRDIRQANDVDTAASTMGTHPGKLVLKTTEAGTPVTLEFYISGGILSVKKDGVDAGTLTRTDVTVTNLVFRNLSNGKSEAVKVEMTLQSVVADTTKVKKFYGSAVLRESY